MQIFTVVEGDYSKGAAALINSIARCGGGYDVHVGWIGEPDIVLRPGARVSIHALPLRAAWAGNRKFELISLIATGRFLFIDADCIVMSPELLQIAAEALKVGPLFCVEGLIPETDIRRVRWLSACESVLGLKGGRRQNLYFNSGFFGGDICRDGEIFRTWQRLIDGAIGDGGLHSVKDFPMADQDCLNAVLQCLTPDMVTLGPPDVWYAASPDRGPFLYLEIAGAPLLLHATGENKPWRYSTVLTRRPNLYELEWIALLTKDNSWCTINTNLPVSVREWLEQSRKGRMLGHVARARHRLAGIGH